MRIVKSAIIPKHQIHNPLNILLQALTQFLSLPLGQSKIPGQKLKLVRILSGINPGPSIIDNTVMNITEQESYGGFVLDHVFEIGPAYGEVGEVLAGEALGDNRFGQVLDQWQDQAGHPLQGNNSRVRGLRLVPEPQPCQIHNLDLILQRPRFSEHPEMQPEIIFDSMLGRVVKVDEVLQLEEGEPLLLLEDWLLASEGGLVGVHGLVEGVISVDLELGLAWKVGPVALVLGGEGDRSFELAVYYSPEY